MDPEVPTPDPPPPSAPAAPPPPPQPLPPVPLPVVPRPPAPRHVAGVTGTRVVLFGWCVWLLGTLAVLTTLDGGAGAGTRARWMVMVAMAGLMLIWPAWRLSERRAGPSAADWSAPARVPGGGVAIFAEWLCLNLVWQLAAWALQLSIHLVPETTARAWTVPQTLWIVLGMAAWTGLTGALIAWGRSGERPGARLVAMLGCAALVVGEPVAMWLASLHNGRPVINQWAMRVSPIEPMWALADPVLNPAVHPWAERVVSVTAAAAAAWVGVLLIDRVARRRASADAPADALPPR